MKKLNRILSLSAAAALALSLTACSGGPSGTADTPAGGSSNTPAAGETYKVAVIKQMDHASLDEIANAITARLDAIAEKNGITIEYEVTSGQGDQTVLRQLSDQAIADGVDAIIPIATTAAQVAAVSAEESKTPVIFAAISYPETVELTGMDYVTGTSDALDTNQILDMMFTQNPDIGSVGLLYSLSEPNSEVPIADAKAYLDAKGVAYTEATANTNDEVIAAASSLIADGVDAVFTPTDNIIMAAELAIYEDFIAAGIPHYTGADSFVRNGAFATCGVNYTDLGAETADLAYQAMTGGMDGLEDYYQVAGGLITVNSETAAALAIDPAVFESLGQVTTVTTTEVKAIGLLAKDKLTTNPCTAKSDELLCNGCSTCANVCPYGAISYEDKQVNDHGIRETRRVAVVNTALCQGCGACTVACPSGAMDLQGFSNRQIIAEVDAICR